jgi:hypothetical protein
MSHPEQSLPQQGRSTRTQAPGRRAPASPWDRVPSYDLAERSVERVWQARVDRFRCLRLGPARFRRRRLGSTSSRVDKHGVRGGARFVLGKEEGSSSPME